MCTRAHKYSYVHHDLILRVNIECDVLVIRTVLADYFLLNQTLLSLYKVVFS